MTTDTINRNKAPGQPQTQSIQLGGYAALAESAWMGSVQATEVLDALSGSLEKNRTRVTLPKIPRIKLGALYLRKLSIPEASFVLMSAFFLSAALGAVRQVLFNAQFGAGMEANAYYAAFRLPDTLFSLIAGGALSSAMIPVLLKIAQDKGEVESSRLVNLVLTMLMIVFLIIVLVGELFTPFFIRRLLAPGFDDVTTSLTIRLTRIMLLQPLILVVGSVATALLNSRNQFIPTAISILGHNITLIGGIFLAGRNPQIGILGPTIGVVAGAIFQGIVLLPGLTAQGVHIQAMVNFADQGLREIIRLLIPNGLSVSVNYAGFILDTAFASQAVNQAGLAAIYNAWLLVGLPIALIGQAIGQAAFPRMAENAENGRWKEMRQTIVRTSAVAIGLSSAALAGLLLFGRPIIRVLFEHGKFDADAGSLTCQVLTIYSLALPAYVITELVSRGLIALRDTRTPLLTNTLQMAVRFILLFVFIRLWDVRAIPAAFAISATLETILLSGVFITRLGRRIRAKPSVVETPGINA